MFNDVFREVLKHDGVVSITTWSEGNVHVSNTWNKYLHISGDDKILIPAAWFNKTEKNIKLNDKLIITLGSSEVAGRIGMGTGFVVDGSGEFLSSGELYDSMKAKFPFLSRVLAVTATSVRQTI